MTTKTYDSKAEQRILSILKDKYETEGYHFYVHPSVNLLPNFLGNFRPDAIAIGDTEKILIEIVSIHSQRKKIQLNELSILLKEHSDWKLRTIFAKDFKTPQNAHVAKVTKTAMENAMRRVDRLDVHDFRNEAYVLLWSIFESCYYMTMQRNDSDLHRISARNAISNMEQLGHLTFTDAKSLRSKLETRNKIVHGNFDVKVSKSEFSKLKFLVEKIVSRTNF